MFTGIVEVKGEVIDINQQPMDPRFYIHCPSIKLSSVAIGASISHAGCCLTVVEKQDAENIYAVDVSAETLSKTTLGRWTKGTHINIERSLKLGDELGGHIVSGHVDGIAVIKDIKKDGDSHKITIAAPDHLAKFIAPKGSVALDGISLTVNEVHNNDFTVNIIPHTWDITTIGEKQIGDEMNIEIDLMARYAARLMEYK